VLGGMRARPGQVVPVTEVIAYILAAGESLPEGLDEGGPSAPPLRATPVARKRAAEAGIDIREIAPGDAGRVRREHVEAYLAAGKPRATPAARRLARELGLGLAGIAGTGPRGRVQAADVRAAGVAAPGAELEETVIPLEGMRQTIARRLQESWRSAPHITFTADADMAAALALRDEFNALAEAVDGSRVSVTAILVKACAWALQRHPRLNASLQGDVVHRYQAANIGVAVAVDEGLIVPVIRRAESLGIGEIAGQLEGLARRAREGRLMPDDVSDGTFTISNLGMYGIKQFTAVINPPQAAILAVGCIAKRAVVIERGGGDRVVVRPLMAMTLSADHRLLDGVVAARFLQDVVTAVEKPGLLLY
jgi:pyruvate dehydrogenase E2 component (dihydrolipoamide acetyltransferase)